MEQHAVLVFERLRVAEPEQAVAALQDCPVHSGPHPSAAEALAEYFQNVAVAEAEEHSEEGDTEEVGQSETRDHKQLRHRGTHGSIEQLAEQWDLCE